MSVTWWHLYIIIFIFSGIMGLVLTPLFQKIAAMTGFMDVPKEQLHKQHGHATPLLGGAAIFTAWGITVTAGFFAPELLNLKSFVPPSVASAMSGMGSVSKEMLFIFIGALLAVLLGLYDDKFNMSARTKLLGQIAVAVIAVTWGGVKITLFFNAAWFSWGVSVFWILLIMNSINFFDNMDGLAVGTAAIAMSLFTIVAIVNHNLFIAALGAATAGAAVGFWFYNHSPAAIFMGDSGSHFLGYMLAVVSAQVTYYKAGVSNTHLPILIPVFILAIPLFDTAAVVAIRLYKHKPIYIGDHNHISHRFVAMGMSRKRAVFLVHLLVVMIGLSVLPLLWGDERTAVVSLVQAGTILLLVSILQYSVSENNVSEKAQPNTP